MLKKPMREVALPAELLGIYTVSGKRVATPLKGQVNIFKYSDGAVKKFYMK